MQVLADTHLWEADLLEGDRHHIVPGDFEDPGRGKSWLVFQALKFCYFLSRTINHYLGVDIWHIPCVVFLTFNKKGSIKTKQVHHGEFAL